MTLRVASATIELSLRSNSRNQPARVSTRFLTYWPAPNPELIDCQRTQFDSCDNRSVVLLRLRSFLANFDLAGIDVQSREIAASHHNHSQCPARLFPYMSVFIFHGIGQGLCGSLVPF